MIPNFVKTAGTALLVLVAGIAANSRPGETGIGGGDTRRTQQGLATNAAPFQLHIPTLLIGSPTYCESLSGSLRAALSSLPKGQEIPCDAQHIVEIADVERFLNAHFQKYPQLNADDLAALKIDIESAYAFVWNLHFPIYVNMWKLAVESHGFDSGAKWLGYALAPLLAHERVHAYGEVRESVAHRAELQLAKTFLKKNLIPQGGYDVRGLQQAIRLADQRESPEWPEVPTQHVE